VHAGELTVGRWKTATGIRTVHYVVVDQCATLKEFKGAGGSDDTIAVGAFAEGGAPAPVAEQRPQPLSTVKK